MALILEVLDPRTGEVRSRHRLDAGEVTIGRGYGNDVVLDDPYADAHHARIAIDQTGALVIEDMGSRNRLLAPDRSRQDRLRLLPNLEVRVGRSRLRFRDAEAPLPAALPDVVTVTGWSRIPGWGTWWGQLGLIVAAMVGIAWFTWLGTFNASPASEVVSMVLGFVLLAAVWCGVWAVAGRVVVHRFRFLGHMALVSGLTLLTIGLAVVDGWAGFLFPDAGWIGPLETIGWLLLMAALVAGQLGLASAMNARRRWIIALITGAGLMATSGILMLAEDDSFSDVASFSSTLKPFPTRLLPTAPVERLTDVAEKLKSEVDALAVDARP